ncbi:uncharacterized protein MONOS_4878 [Monocercomonoides exilis]|uniref:uncharacterized protein n=1 Tax=Monocercomonoides exilis TaxID=2049356 RepID=UPI003559382F|nr:hypothetical protein MONOS_4878 [Monocercomonoides exilis]|eukprot:MONOS_4878.1-p1 / transcript=MONOS_4878.1 / gene=MONOS_4878 / organism=Monocercomonoides_exilis_PA203 / gene_product=unspecified product / transcript_product=unspecified product / location=Mono_scaffold00136:46525-47163(+) / protein_length=213 / sequence_SO=supercontig / SO=protein_coding / is_pseudo=false
MLNDRPGARQQLNFSLTGKHRWMFQHGSSPRASALAQPAGATARSSSAPAPRTPLPPPIPIPILNLRFALNNSFCAHGRLSPVLQHLNPNRQVPLFPRLRPALFFHKLLNRLLLFLPFLPKPQSRFRSPPLHNLLPLPSSICRSCHGLMRFPVVPLHQPLHSLYPQDMRHIILRRLDIPCRHQRHACLDKPCTVFLHHCHSVLFELLRASST